MNSGANTIQKPVIEHIRELQHRLMWSILFVCVGGIVGYALNDTLLALIQKPLGQTLYYTTPTGGFSFIFKMSVTFGLIFSVPIIVYNILRYIKPAFRRISTRQILMYLVWSMSLAFAGVLFAYFVSLPAALHFLTQIGGTDVQSLITADEYFNFALAYIAGFAVLFQFPLIIGIINRIKPLKPSKMMGAQRYIILGSFVVAAILTPTPDPVNQLIMALPVVLLYQFGIIMVWVVNLRRRKQTADVSHSTNFTTDSTETETETETTVYDLDPVQSFK